MPARSASLSAVLRALAKDCPEQAVILARDALRSAPQDAGLHAALGIALCCRGDLPAAHAMIERAHYLAPEDPRILYNYGLILEKMGHYPEARVRYYAAIKLDPAYDRALAHLADLPQVSVSTSPPALPDVIRARDASGADTVIKAQAPAAPQSPAAWPSIAYHGKQSTGGQPYLPHLSRFSGKRLPPVIGGALALVTLALTAFFRGPTPPVLTGAQAALRGALPGHPAQVHTNMSAAQLAGSSFPGVNFNGVNLRKADLNRANLRGATFAGADLRGTQLAKAILIGAVLEEANLEGTYLLGANLWGADLRQANLRRAYLKAAKLGQARLDGAALREAILTFADLSSANLQHSDLRGARLDGADLRGADLRGAALHAADLRLAHLHRADLSGATYDQATRWPAGLRPSIRGALLTAEPGNVTRSRQK